MYFPLRIQMIGISNKLYIVYKYKKNSPLRQANLPPSPVSNAANLSCHKLPSGICSNLDFSSMSFFLGKHYQELYQPSEHIHQKYKYFTIQIQKNTNTK